MHIREALARGVYGYALYRAEQATGYSYGHTYHLCAGVKAEDAAEAYTAMCALVDPDVVMTFWPTVHALGMAEYGKGDE